MLELKNIVKSFGGNVILDDISLNIEEGELYQFWDLQEAVRRPC